MQRVDEYHFVLENKEISGFIQNYDLPNQDESKYVSGTLTDEYLSGDDLKKLNEQLKYQKSVYYSNEILLDEISGNGPIDILQDGIYRVSLQGAGISQPHRPVSQPVTFLEQRAENFTKYGQGIEFRIEGNRWQNTDIDYFDFSGLFWERTYYYDNTYLKDLGKFSLTDNFLSLNLEHRLTGQVITEDGVQKVTEYWELSGITDALPIVKPEKYFAFQNLELTYDNSDFSTFRVLKFSSQNDSINNYEFKLKDPPNRSTVDGVFQGSQSTFTEPLYNSKYNIYQDQDNLVMYGILRKEEYDNRIKYMMFSGSISGIKYPYKDKNLVWNSKNADPYADGYHVDPIKDLKGNLTSNTRAIGILNSVFETDFTEDFKPSWKTFNYVNPLSNNISEVNIQQPRSDIIETVLSIDKAEYNFKVGEPGRSSDTPSSLSNIRTNALTSDKPNPEFSYERDKLYRSVQNNFELSNELQLNSTPTPPPLTYTALGSLSEGLYIDIFGLTNYQLQERGRTAIQFITLPSSNRLVYSIVIDNKSQQSAVNDAIEISPPIGQDIEYYRSQQLVCFIKYKWHKYEIDRESSFISDSSGNKLDIDLDFERITNFGEKLSLVTPTINFKLNLVLVDKVPRFYALGQDKEIYIDKNIKNNLNENLKKDVQDIKVDYSQQTDNKVVAKIVYSRPDIQQQRQPLIAYIKKNEFNFNVLIEYNQKTLTDTITISYQTSNEDGNFYVPLSKIFDIYLNLQIAPYYILTITKGNSVALQSKFDYFNHKSNKRIATPVLLKETASIDTIEVSFDDKTIYRSFTVTTNTFIVSAGDLVYITVTWKNENDVQTSRVVIDPNIVIPAGSSIQAPVIPNDPNGKYYQKLIVKMPQQSTLVEINSIVREYTLTVLSDRLTFQVDKYKYEPGELVLLYTILEKRFKLNKRECYVEINGIRFYFQHEVPTNLDYQPFTWKKDSNQSIVRQSTMDLNKDLRRYDVNNLLSFAWSLRTKPEIYEFDGGIFQDLNDMLRITIEEQADLYLQFNMQNQDMTINIITSYLANQTLLLAESQETTSIKTIEKGYYRITSVGQRTGNGAPPVVVQLNGRSPNTLGGLNFRFTYPDKVMKGLDQPQYGMGYANFNNSMGGSSADSYLGWQKEYPLPWPIKKIPVWYPSMLSHFGGRQVNTPCFLDGSNSIEGLRMSSNPKSDTVGDQNKLYENNKNASYLQDEEPYLKQGPFVGGYLDCIIMQDKGQSIKIFNGQNGNDGVMSQASSADARMMIPGNGGGGGSPSIIQLDQGSKWTMTDHRKLSNIVGNHSSKFTTKEKLFKVLDTKSDFLTGFLIAGGIPGGSLVLESGGNQSQINAFYHPNVEGSQLYHIDQNWMSRDKEAGGEYGLYLPINSNSFLNAESHYGGAFNFNSITEEQLKSLFFGTGWFLKEYAQQQVWEDNRFLFAKEVKIRSENTSGGIGVTTENSIFKTQAAVGQKFIQPILHEIETSNYFIVQPGMSVCTSDPLPYLGKRATDNFMEEMKQTYSDRFTFYNTHLSGKTATDLLGPALTGDYFKSIFTQARSIYNSVSITYLTNQYPEDGQFSRITYLGDYEGYLFRSSISSLPIQTQEQDLYRKIDGNLYSWSVFPQI